ncbi:MAG: hypothetical protein QOJ68_972 [Blastococcus sp.]|nr:hypothetical protein [Blastococcus sp.]
MGTQSARAATLGTMPRREDDDVAPRHPAASSGPRRRSLVLGGGFVLAVLATLAVFLTDNPQYLRVAVVAVAWAFVLATFAAGRRGSDRAAAEAREAELRSVYERELDREVAARREYELELENVLRRETEDAMRYELDALRGEIAALAGLRDEVARVTELRGDLSALGGLRDEIGRLAALRDDVASLGALRQDLGQMGELRADLGRMRDDLANQLNDQLSSEMLVERIVMRTQGSRPEPTGRSVEGTASWTDEPPPALTGGWPAIRLDEPQETRQFHELRRPEPARAEPVRPVPPPPPARRIDEMPSWAAESAAFDLFGPAEPYASGSREDDREMGSGHHSRHAAEESSAAPRTEMSAVVPPPEPVRPSLRPRPSPHPSRVRSMPDVPNRRLRAGSADEPVTGEQPSGPRPSAAARPVVPPAVVRPAVPPSKPARPAAPPTVSTPIAPPSAGGPSTGSSVAQILAQNGGGPATGSRRHRRYREDDAADDVLARVLREN